MTDTVCASGVDLLMEYFEGLLPPATVAALEAHVARCEKCQAFVASYQTTPRLLRDATDIPMPADLRHSLIAWLQKNRN